MSLKLLLLALFTSACAFPSQALEEVTSSEPCDPCQPQGATDTNPPTVGSDLRSLYIDVLASVKGISFRKRYTESLEIRQKEGFCCQQSLNCVNVQGLNIPMCYDKFTTNFAFQDGSYGSLTTGNYSSGGSSVNLVSGDYNSSSGERGNIYANDPQAKPNTATLSIPPQFTGTGVGQPIPATELGSVIVYTTTIPGTTYTAPTTVAGTVMSGKTLAGTTVAQATTIAAQTSVVTITNGAAVSSASSKGVAEPIAGSPRAVGMPFLSALMYALYAL